MMENKDWFSNLEEDFNRRVKLRNNTRMVVAPKGSIMVQLNGITQVISDVYYILGLKNSLLSIEQL